MNSSWKKFIAVVVLAIFASMYWGLMYKYRKQSTDTSCHVADTVGYHQPTSYPVTCPDPRQKLAIERQGAHMGFFEYRCHCE